MIFESVNKSVQYFHGSFLRNLFINLSDNLDFENSVTDFTPHVLSKG